MQLDKIFTREYVIAMDLASGNGRTRDDIPCDCETSDNYSLPDASVSGTRDHSHDICT